MGKKLTRRFYRRLLLAIAVVISVVAVYGIIGSFLCLAHGRVLAIIPLAICVGLVWIAERIGESAEKRMG